MKETLWLIVVETLLILLLLLLLLLLLSGEENQTELKLTNERDSQRVDGIVDVDNQVIGYNLSSFNWFNQIITKEAPEID